MSPAADNVIRRLDAARQKWWFFTLLTTAVLGLCVSLGVLLALMLTDVLMKFSQPVLWVMFVGWLAVDVALMVFVGRRLGRSHRTLEATARRVESEYPELGSNLINVVQLSSDTKNQNRPFCDAAVTEAATLIGHVRFEEAPTKENRWRRFCDCMQTPRDLSESFAVLGVTIAIAVACHLIIPNWGSAASRLMNPWEFVPSVGSVEIKVAPGDTKVLLGESLDITGTINNPQGKPYRATLFITPDGEKETDLPMEPDEEHLQYKLTLPSVEKPLKYRLEIGDSQTEIYTVEIREKPIISKVKIVLRYPPYLKRKPKIFERKQADFEAPQYSVAELRITPSGSVKTGHVMANGQKLIGAVRQDKDDGTVLVVKNMRLLKNTTFTVHMFNDAGHTDPDPRVNHVRVLGDKPPTVQLLKPGRQSSGTPGGEVPVLIRAGDDYGVSRVRLHMKIKASAPAEGAAQGEQPNEIEVMPVTTVRQWTKFEKADKPTVTHRLELSPDQIRPGQTVLLQAVAWDNADFGEWGQNLKPQKTTSGWHAIRIIATEAKAQAALDQLDSLRGAIWKILEKQLRTRANAARIRQQEQPARAIAMAGDVRSGQLDVQTSSIALVKSIGRTDKEERLAVKQVLNKLAFGDMLEAVRQCDALTKIKAVAAFAKGTDELTATQDRIIDVLRKLLDVARRAQSEVLAEMKKRAVGDLPDDTRKKLEDLRNKLDEFLEQQKKVIEASENLAKTPVEDFTEEEEQLIEKLANTEDEWSKFMKDLHSDLSKLPDQDFANSVMAKELNEIQTELKMAEDALLKKTADIAVPLEQLGAEMAEEIKTNLEKWLPDTPDRERWSQEESLSDEGKEAPMAELPGELEDLVGELMEEEEDLFDEMEDVSSSAADSADKGVGWDATDGPISNMSAKGVTGNRLPNTSEIGGRSGEGRSGKSSGEFVGDEAVGKGGRKTPSRLTPDPVLKGQVKDHSRDPQGGASGGGKESGQGGEGLEGPSARPPGDRNMQRLAGKQAALRNKAEGVDLQFQIMNFHHTDLQKMIELMAQIERDLKAGRYQNALRQRKVLAEGLGDVKQYVQGEFQVRQDKTANLPSDIQKEILGGMQDRSPVGWEELNRQYFERLATGGASGEGGRAVEINAGGPAPDKEK